MARCLDGLLTAGWLARLAGRVAQLTEVGEGFRGRLTGFTRAFPANGLRVAGKLREADGEMETAKRLWRAGEDPGRARRARQ